jgi:biotin carboxylase
LSESPEFAKACIVFVGPTVENLLRFSDKTAARSAAIEAGVPVVPGSDGAMKTTEEVIAFVEQIGLPVILKVRDDSTVNTEKKLEMDFKGFSPNCTRIGTH